MTPQNYAESVAAEVIKQLEQGTAPWVKPWAPGELRAPYNPTTDKPYRGMNAVWLSMQGRGDPRWLTYKQASGLGAQVQRGSKGCQIEYWKFHEDRPKLDDAGKPVLDENGRPQTVKVELDRPRRFVATVFNAEQIDGLAPLPAASPRPEPERHERAEAILANSGAKIRHVSGDRAYYAPGADSITLPERQQFRSGDAYYATALHELGHWTGHPSRLDRDLSHPFGSEGYAKEELRAELASLMLGEKLEIGHDPGQHVAYIGSWIKALQDDPREIFRAAADADKIGGYVLGLEVAQSQQAAPAVDPTTFNIFGTDLRFDNLLEAVKAFGKEHKGRYPLRAEHGGEEISLIYHDWYNDGSNHRLEFRNPSVERLFTAVQKGNELEAAAAENLVLDQLDGIADNLRRRRNPGNPASQTQENRPMPAEARTTKKTYLAVPYADKEDAKRLGARWDATAKSWYAPAGVWLQESGLARWRPEPTAPKPAAIGPEQAFADELKRHGLVLTAAPVMDGKLYRVPVEGDKGSERSGAYVGHNDGLPSGFIQNFKTGTATNWRHGDSVATLSSAEKAQAAAAAVAHKQKRDADRAAAQDSAKATALALWSESAPATGENDYCKKKMIEAPKGLRTVPSAVSDRAQAAGVRIAESAQGAKQMREAEPQAHVFRKGDLLVPLFNERGDLHGVQSVNPWFKGFMHGARKAGLYSVAGAADPAAFNAAVQANTTMPIVIAEGYATGDTLAKALGHPVIVGIDSGNLDPVARQMREKYPDRALVIAADNDPKVIAGRPRNVGVEKATSAAKNNGGAVLVADPEKGSDWNDYAAEHGLDKTTKVIADRMAKAKSEASIAAAKMRYYAHERIADAVDNSATAADNSFVATERDKAARDIVAATGREDNIRAGLESSAAARNPASSKIDMSGTTRQQESAGEQVRQQRADVLDGTSNSTDENPGVRFAREVEDTRRQTRGRARGR